MANPKLKLSWAEKHLRSLHLELLSFCIPANAYTERREEDIKNQRYILRLQLNDVPDPICLICGDAFYSMRSSLDQLVWSLARLNCIPTGTQFPILTELTTVTIKKFKARLVGVPDEATCEIKALQPYHRGDAYKTHPLWRLHEMCNLDKHRRIPANGSETIFRFPEFSAEDFANGVIRYDNAGDNGLVVSVPLPLKDKLYVDPAMPITVNFGGDTSGICENANGIAEIYDFIASAVFPRFERFFPQ